LAVVGSNRSPSAVASATLREKLVKIGAKVVTHSRYVIFQRADVFVPEYLLGVAPHGPRGQMTA